MYTEREFSKSNTFDFSFLLFSYFCQQSVILNFKAASGIFKKGHLWHSLTQKCLKITLFLEKGHFLVKCYKEQRPTTGR